MGADKPDEEDAKIVAYGDYEAILVPTDVEDDTVVGDDACRSIPRLDSARRLPGGSLRFSIPRAERLLCVGVLFPKHP